MNKKYIVFSSLLSSLALILPAAPSIAAVKQREVTIVFQAPKTGPNGQVGLDQVIGVKIAIDQYNSTNPRVKIKLKEVDDTGNPAIAATKAQENILDQSVVGVIGPITSGAAKASFPAYKAGKLAMVCTACAVPALTDPTDPGNGLPVFHRVVLNDSFQAPALVDYAISGVTNPKIFLADDSTTYGKSLAALNTTYTQSKSLSVVGTDSIPSATVDFSATVAKVLDSDANVVIFSGYYGDSGHFVKALRAAGYKGIYAASAGSVIQSFITEAGDTAAEGARLTIQQTPFDLNASKEQMALYNKYADGVPVTNKQYVTEGFNAATVFITLIKSGSTSRSQILSRIGRASYVGLGGMKFSFDPFGDIVGGAPFARWTVENGKLKYIKPVSNRKVSTKR